ncbi:ribonuclease P protein component [Candidatus Omnitrophota bacterium]
MMPPRPPARTTTRLIKSGEFRHVYTTGKRIKGEVAWLYFVKSGQGHAARLGISIGKRIIKKSIDRNRIKRIIKEWYRQNPRSSSLGGCDIVVVIKKQIETTPSASKRLRDELRYLTRQAA